MKKLLTFIMSLLFVGTMIAQPVVTPAALDLGVTSRDLPASAVRCDIELGAYEQPNDDTRVFQGLHSTDGTSANGGIINLGMAEDFNIPQLAAHGLQVIQSVQIAGFGQGNSGGMPIRIELWSDNAGAPGGMLSQETMTGINPGGFASPLEFEPPASWSVVNVNTNYWLSLVGNATGLGGGVTRWFWGTTTPAQNGGEEFSVYYNWQGGNGFGGQPCNQWTTVSNCGIVAAGANMGAAFKFNLCQNAALDLGGTPVPTMTQWGLFLFGLIILTLGVVSIYNFSRRRVAE